MLHDLIVKKIALVPSLKEFILSFAMPLYKLSPNLTKPAKKAKLLWFRSLVCTQQLRTFRNLFSNANALTSLLPSGCSGLVCPQQLRTFRNLFLNANALTSLLPSGCSGLVCPQQLRTLRNRRLKKYAATPRAGNTETRIPLSIIRMGWGQLIRLSTPIWVRIPKFSNKSPRTEKPP